MPTTTGRGYGHGHQREREQHRPAVEAGEADCTEPICINPAGRWIEPGTPWDLAHDREHGGYLGPAHSQCNRSEGATYGNANRGGTGTPSDAW